MKSSSVRLSIRASSHQRELIYQAAARCGQSRSSFMLEAACRRAEQVLYGHAAMAQDDTTARSFLALLDQPPEPTDALRRTLKATAPWATIDVVSAAEQRER